MLTLNRTTVVTLISKITILVLNFGVVLFTTRLWGAEGRGFIALFVADISLVAIFINIFTSSSVSYYSSRLGINALLAPAYLWSFVVSTVVAIVFMFTKNSTIALFFLTISSLSGLLAFHNALFIGLQKIKPYNIITVLQPLLLIIFMITLHVTTSLSYYSYFIAQIGAIAILLTYAWRISQKEMVNPFRSFSLENAKQLFLFGWKTELSNFLQFLNYRIAFYALAFYLGEASVGIFSVGVAISEALWVFSRSISVVQYSKILREGDTLPVRKEIIRSSFLSAALTMGAASVLLLFPAPLFSTIFGPEFTQIKPILAALLPGIIAISVGNLFANYFSAIRNLNILIIKSTIGVILNILFLILLLEKHHLFAACYAASISYTITSFVLIIYFIIKKRTKK